MLGQWAPDSATVGSDDLTIARNVYAGAGGYKPFKGLVPISGALPEAFKGGVSYMSGLGEAQIVVGTETDLYKLQTGTWDSMLGSLTVPTFWQFAQFGTHAIAVNGGAPVDIDLVSGTAAELVEAEGTIPTADLVTVVRDFVVLGRTDDDPTMITWSGYNDMYKWDTGVDEAGFQPMLTGGEIMGITGGESGLILQRDRIVRMTYTTDPDAPFQFDEISTNYGCIAEKSVAQAGDITFCYSRRGFIKIQAGAVTEIGAERISDLFRNSYNAPDYAALSVSVDPERSLVIWVIYNKGYCYNWTLDRWTELDAPVQATFASFSQPVSIDDLDAIYGDLDSIPYSLDDVRFAGGNYRVTAVGSDGICYVFGGDPMRATIRKATQEFFPGQVARLREAYIETDAVSGVTLELACQQRLGDAQASTSYTTLRDSGAMPVRNSARFITPKITIAAGTNWTFLKDMRFKAESGGTR